MPSADQVSIDRPHFENAWGKWVALIAGSTSSALRAVRPPKLQVTPCDIVHAANARGRASLCDGTGLVWSTISQRQVPRQSRQSNGRQLPPDVSVVV